MKKVTTEDIRYQIGIPESLRDDAVKLYDEAFGPKFAVAIKDKEKRLILLRDSLQLPFAVAAIVNDKLIGLAGFHTVEDSLTKGITGKRLFNNLGLLKSVWAAMIFSLYERKPNEKELLMDGIAVSSEMRGYGIGTQLLNHLKEYGNKHNFSTIRLDVIDINNDARRLYEKQGFKATQTNHFGYLRWLLGFGGSTTMIFDIKRQA